MALRDKVGLCVVIILSLLILAIFAFTFFLAALTFVAVSSVIGLFKYNYSPVNNDVHSIISTHRRSRRNEDIIDI